MVSSSPPITIPPPTEITIPPSANTYVVPPITIPPMPCPAVTLPTKADLTNLFSQLATLPAQLQAAAGGVITEEVRAINALLEPIRKLLDAYDPKFKSQSKPDVEWEIMWTRMIQEFPGYVMSEMMKLIEPIIPVEFVIPIPLVGIEIDLLQLYTPAYRVEIKAQIAAEYEKFHALLPASRRAHSGENGVLDPEQMAETVWSYIMGQVNLGALGLLFAAFDAIISKFKVIFDNLGLPSIPTLLNIMDTLEGLLDAGIELATATARAVWKELTDEAEAAYLAAKDVVRDVNATAQELKTQAQATANAAYNVAEARAGEAAAIGKAVYDAILEIPIPVPGFPTVESIIGGDINGFTTKDPEVDIERLVEAIWDFAYNWAKELLFEWLALITSFLEAVGLAPLVELITFNFCDYMTLLGIPKSLDLSFSDSITVSDPVDNDDVVVDSP